MVKFTVGKNNSVVFRLILSFKVLNWKGNVSKLKCVNCLSICLKTKEPIKCVLSGQLQEISDTFWVVCVKWPIAARYILGSSLHSG
jgi:hypothetical protein